MRRIFIYIIAAFVVVFSLFLIFREKEEPAYKPIVLDSDRGVEKEINNPMDYKLDGVSIDDRFDGEYEMQNSLDGYVKNLGESSKINENAKKLLENRAHVEDTMLKLASNRVDAINFVFYKDEYKDRYVESHTESYPLARKVPLFIQWDPRWGYKMYEDYFAIIGCGPTSVAMILNAYGEKKTPIDMMEEMVANGAYLKDLGTSWDGIKKTLRDHGMNVSEIPLGERKFINVLNEGNQILLSMREGKFTTGGHYMVLVGVTEDGKFLLNDPNSVRYSVKTWDYSELQNEIKGCWSVGK
ncbi:MAG: C39 family peptidase [Ezakiella sp.]|uniref:C39 family peptidase n=1 Tax=Ezakiella sp. TaxID=1935205 RepID=UPI002979B8D3|nr:C39 family peptidase [Ezakiella sp.]MDD7731153.1 C39 family peptidase [Eubacteriales bacterium]MDY6080554.1 C39 family peptidase [Ezakiella sp.]